MPVYPQPTPKGAEFQVNAIVPGNQYGSTITTLADGDFVVAWAGSRAAGSTEYDIFLQRYSAAGVRLGAEEVQVNTAAIGGTTTGFEHGPAVTALKDGGFVVTWVDNPEAGAGDYNVFARRYDKDGNGLGEFKMNTADGFHDQPVITALVDGGFVAVWVGPGTVASGMEIRAQRYGADGKAAGDEFLVNASQAGDQKAPAVTALANGGFVVAWSGPGADGPDVFARQYTAGGVAGDEFRANTATAGDQLRPTVSALADGGYVVAWVGNPVAGANNYDVLAQRYWADGSKNGGEFRINATDRADENGSLDIIALSDGGFLASWGGIGAGDAGDVYAQRFLQNGGAAWDTDFRLNARTGEYQYGPAITSDGAGGFVATWSEKMGPGANGPIDVYARRFDLPAQVSGVSIAADPPPARSEGAAGAATNFTFTVTLDTPVPAAAQTVRWQVQVEGAGPVAASAADFVGGALPGGTLTFAPGEVRKTVTVAVAGDAAAEWNEAFAVRLSDHSAGIGLVTRAAAATILDDDATFVSGTGENDSFAGRRGKFSYDGGGKHDTLDWSQLGFRGTTVELQADGSVLLTRGADVALLRGVEEVSFLDGRLAFAPYDQSAKVARLYEAALDRLPDQGGLNFWSRAVQNGEPLTKLAEGFIASAEFQSRFGGASVDNGAFVDRLYQNVLGRAGEAEGRAFWVNSLNGGGASRAEVLVAFSESKENEAGTAALVQNGIWDRSESAAEVARMYDTVFGRRPDAEGLTFWKNALDAGTVSREGMADSFAGSAEFLAKYGALDNRGFANALYVNTLDRPADQAGLDFWTASLNNGAARSEVVLAFSESAEHVALTAPAIGGEARGEYGILFA